MEKKNLVVCHGHKFCKPALSAGADGEKVYQQHLVTKWRENRLPQLPARKIQAKHFFLLFFNPQPEQSSSPKWSNPVGKKSHFLLELWRFAGQGKKAQLADKCDCGSWWNLSRWSVCLNTVINHRAPGYNQTAAPTNSFPPWVSFKSQGNVWWMKIVWVNDPQRPVSHRWFRPTSCCTRAHQASLPPGESSTRRVFHRLTPGLRRCVLCVFKENNGQKTKFFLPVQTVSHVLLRVKKKKKRKMKSNCLYHTICRYSKHTCILFMLV